MSAMGPLEPIQAPAVRREPSARHEPMEMAATEAAGGGARARHAAPYIDQTT